MRLAKAGLEKYREISEQVEGLQIKNAYLSSSRDKAKQDCSNLKATIKVTRASVPKSLREFANGFENKGSGNALDDDAPVKVLQFSNGDDDDDDGDIMTAETMKTLRVLLVATKINMRLSGSRPKMIACSN